uniref:MADF domain-containing protein n=1 Tax=Steinernema glaseri TaxID=37863 RepID=A0A1I7ZI50_9BILA
MNDTTPLFTLPPPQEAPSGHEDVQDGAMDKKSPPFSFPLQPFGQVAPENVQHGTMNKEIIQRQPFTFDEMNNLWEIIMEEMRRDNDKVPDPRTTKFWRRMKAKHQNLWRLENTYAKK